MYDQNTLLHVDLLLVFQHVLRFAFQFGGFFSFIFAYVSRLVYAVIALNTPTIDVVSVMSETKTEVFV